MPFPWIGLSRDRYLQCRVIMVVFLADPRKANELTLARERHSFTSSSGLWRAVNPDASALNGYDGSAL